MIKLEILERIEDVLDQDTDAGSKDLELLRHNLEKDLLKQEVQADDIRMFRPNKDILIKNNDIVVKKSKLHGYGVFAKNKIKKGEILEECHLINVDIPTHPYIFSYPKNHTPDDNDFDLVIPSGYGFVYNSSSNCFEANATWISKDNMFTFISIKDIEKNQEILIEYSKFLSGSDEDYSQKELDYMIKMDKFAESITKQQRINNGKN